MSCSWGKDGELEKGGINPNFLIRNWPPAFTEWSAKSVRETFFASPQFPRLLHGEVLRDTIARGVRESRLAYVGKADSETYDPFYYGPESGLDAEDVELSDDMFLITKETAENYKKKKERPPQLTSLVINPQQVQIQPGKRQTFMVRGLDQDGHAITTEGLVWTATGGTIDQNGVFLAGQDEGSFIVTAATEEVRSSATVVISAEPTQPQTPSQAMDSQAKGLRWTGSVPPQKWMNFYTKVLSRFAASKGLKLTLTVEVAQDSGNSEQKIEETKVALRELGLNDDVEVQ